MGKPPVKSANPSTKVVVKTEEKKEEPKKLTFEDIPMWINPKDKLPVFVASYDDDTVMDLIEAKKYKVYYLIASENYSYEGKSGTGVSVTKHGVRTRTFKVVNNLLGRSVHGADDTIKMWKPPTGLTLNLPKIPIELIDKIDSFFRHVDDKLGTESIVILTYDTAVGGAEGWGFVVPEQKNTSTNCDYDPPSAIARIPKSAFMAGSAHSHPNMSAYASHTDVGDQLDFDGIHITFGWKGKGPTEYYIEAQMHGMAYVFQPEGIFSYAPKEGLPDKVLEEYMEFVEKKSYQTGYQSGKGGQSQTTTTGTKHGTGTSQSGGYKLPQGVQVYLPEGSPDPYSNILIGKLDIEKDHKCPFCWTVITSIDKEHRRCFTCMFMIADMDESIDDLIDFRKEKHLTVAEFEKHASVHFMFQGKYSEADVPATF